MSDNVIEITNLNKEYKMFHRKSDRLIESVFPSIKRHTTFKAMENVNLQLKRGEILGILGKNGSGKSTLLKMITGVVTPTSGEMMITGKISSLLELGTSFNLELTGEDNIYQHGQVMGMTNDEIEAKKQEIIDFADIGEHLYQPVKTYSSGMFARLAFACAINVEPDILIVDEVLSVGDMAFQLKCFKKFEEFKQKARTILFVTHSINDILTNCTRTIILSDGKKIFDGDVKEGVDKYKKLSSKINIHEDKKQEVIKKNNNIKDNTNWKSNFDVNENMLVYGDKQVDIIDYGLFNLKNKIITNIYNNEEVIIKMKVKFNEDIKDPIFAMTIKNFNGLEICGSNTIEQSLEVGSFKKGNIVEVSFKQKLPLTPNRYTISFGCTKFDPNGELHVYDRHYDCILTEIISIKACSGLIDIDSNISIE